MTNRAHYDIIIIGGGQAGLSAGYHVAKSGLRLLILDAHKRVGDAWRKRYDSLTLFTPARFNGLPGMPFPGGRGDVVTKDEMADYLELYAEQQQLPVRCGVRVQRLSKPGERFVIETDDAVLEADQVVVAMSNYQVPKVPDFAEELDPTIFQIHSKHYRNPGQLREGSVLVVGGGNSAADIALELSRTHRTTMAGKPAAHIPFRIEPWFARHVLISLVRFVGHFILNLRTPLGRKVRPAMLRMAAPLVRVKPTDLTDAGVQPAARVAAVRDGLPMLEDGSVTKPDNVVWCTGFRTGFSWIDLPILDEHEEPAHERGVATGVSGLFFAGLHFQFAATSDTITGVSRDAKYVARRAVAAARHAQRRADTATRQSASAATQA